MTTVRADASAELLADRVEGALTRLFGSSQIAQDLLRATRRYREDCHRLSSNRGIELLTIALIGAKGQGKTWLTRQLVRREDLRARLPSGFLRTEGTEKLTWIGPQGPHGRDATTEEYYHCAAADMADLGQPYVVLDTPGFTDANTHAAAMAQEALSSAQVKFLLIRRERLRDEQHAMQAALTNGAIVVPIITAVRDGDERVGDDVKMLQQHLRASAPKSTLLDPVLVKDFPTCGDEEAIARQTIEGIKAVVQQAPWHLSSAASLWERQLEARTERFRDQVRALLSELAPGLHAAIEHLETEVEQLPAELITSLLGSQSILRAGIRTRLRYELVSQTWPLWFPYRTLLGILNITHGAWDKVVLSVAGSMPSLFSSLMTTVRNVRDAREWSQEMQEGVKRRLLAMVRDRLRPLAMAFHTNLDRLVASTTKGASQESFANIRLTGIDELQQRSTAIFERAIGAHAIFRAQAQLAGLTGTMIFWLFLGGPIVALYRQYWTASQSAFGVAPSLPSLLDTFPIPPPSMMMTSLFLSLLPIVVFAMAFLTVTLREQKIAMCAATISQDRHEAIAQLKRDGILRVEFEDPRLEEARFLLSL